MNWSRVAEMHLLFLPLLFENIFLQLIEGNFPFHYSVNFLSMFDLCDGRSICGLKWLQILLMATIH